MKSCYILLVLFVATTATKSVFNNCGLGSEIEKLIIIGKEIQVQVEVIKPKQNVVELRLL